MDGPDANHAAILGFNPLLDVQYSCQWRNTVINGAIGICIQEALVTVLNQYEKFNTETSLTLH